MTGEKRSAPRAPEGFLEPRALAGLAPDALLAVALSGGADSVALLLATPPPAVAVHVHHGIRGAEADRDAAFCRALCARLGIPFTCLYADVPALAQKTGESLETTARNERYRLLAAHAKACGAHAVLTAHHADDQLETVLLHLLRGSGLRGLCGIPPVRPLEDTLLVRPMLSVLKEEILSFLSARGETFVEDSTNAGEDCQRNRLRLRVIPELKRLAPDAARRAASTTVYLSQDEAYLTSLATDFLEKESRTPPVAALAALPRPILVRVIQQLLPVDLSAAHMEALAQLVSRAVPHSSLSLPHLRARVENGRLLLEPPEKDAPTEDYLLPLSEGENELPCGRALAVFGSAASNPLPEQKNLYKYAISVSFLSDKVNGRLCVRNRRAGDRILSGGMHRAVRRLPGLSGLPLETRRRMPLLVDDGGVLSVPGAALRDGMDGKEKNDCTVWLYFD